jgi:hypothetical protein
VVPNLIDRTRLCCAGVAAAFVLAVPGTAYAYVGEPVTGPPDPRIVIAEGQFAAGGQREDGSPYDGRWSLEARRCGDESAEHAQFLLLVADHPRDTDARPLCFPGWANNPIHEISIAASVGAPSGSVFARTMFYGGVSPRVDAVELLVDGAWVPIPVRRLAPEQTAAAGFAPGFAFYYLEAAPGFSGSLGARALSSGQVVDCVGQCQVTPAKKAHKKKKKRKARHRGARGGKNGRR